MKTINTYISEKLRLSAKRQYTCQPENKYELKRIILQRIKDEGPTCDLNDIDVSKITNMANLFDVDYGILYKDFNVDISMWDVSNVKNMRYMFFGCQEFDCDLSRWNVSNVENMYYMFNGCKKFNQNLDSWDVSNVDSMYYAFKDCPTQPKWYK